jgi:hypothetical protein
MAVQGEHLRTGRRDARIHARWQQRCPWQRTGREDRRSKVYLMALGALQFEELQHRSADLPRRTNHFALNRQALLGTASAEPAGSFERNHMADPPALPHAGSNLFSERLLVVRQKPEIVDSIPVYAVLDQNGAHVGSVADIGRRDLSTALRPDRLRSRATPGTDRPAKGLIAAFKLVSSTARQVPYRLEVWNEVGVAVLVLTSAEWGERAHITVARGDGVTIGTITWQERLLRKSHYALEAGGREVGTVVVDRRRTVEHHRVLDVQEREVARIAPRRHGWIARALAREPASLLVQISLPLPDPLHSLVLAGALTADTALKRQEPSDTGSG